MAASGFAASARLAEIRDSAARRAMACATSCGRPKRRSRPGNVEGDGVVRRLLHRRGELEGERGQIALAVKTGEHAFLRSVDVARTRMPRKSRPGLPARPFGALAGAFDRQRGAGFGIRLPRQREEHSRRIFDGAAQAEPRSQRDAAGGRERRVAEIHRHDAEAAALNEEVGGLEGVLGVFGGTNPNETVEADAGGVGGGGVEGLVGIDEGAGFAAAGGGGEDGVEQGSASGRSRTDDLRQTPAGELDFGDRRW